MAKVKTNKKRKWMVFSILLLLIAGLAVAAVLKKKDLIIPVQEEKAARRTVIETVVANGKIQPVVQVKISPEVSGEILELPFKEGQDVKKGDLLVSIRPDNYSATRDSQLANFKYSIANSNNAYANLEKADLEYQRNTKLFRQKLISDSDFLTAKTSFDVAKATLSGAAEQVDMALASLRSAESDLSKTKIFSPLDGKITKLGSQAGERVVGTAMMAGTQIMTVSDLNAIEARVDIGENDVVLIAIGQKAHLEVDSFKDRKFEGVVTDIANSANNNDTSGTTTTSSSTTEATKFQVKIRIKDNEIFLPGMSVTAEIETRTHTNVITVPVQSVTTRLPTAFKNSGQTNFAGMETNNSNAITRISDKHKPDEPPKPVEVVFLVKDDATKMVRVKRGISDDNYVEILTGVEDGAEVVSGSYKAINRELEDGKHVTISTAKPGEESKGN